MIYKKIILFIVLVSNLFAIDAELDIIRKQSTIPNISVVVTNNTVNAALANKIKVLLEKDLEVSGHFNVELSKFTTDSIFDQIRYNNKLLIKTDLLLNLEINKNTKKNIEVIMNLIDINKKQSIYKKTYSITNSNRYPFLSHKIAIAINDHLKAPSIKWMDRFVIFARYTEAKKSEIVVADYTLTYQKTVVKGGLNIFPKWANKDQDSFYYTSYASLYPALIHQDLYTSKSKKLLDSDGMIVCSDVSDDGSKIIVTMAPEGQPDIYIYDVKSKIKTRLTTYKGIDVGGNFVENNTKVIFVSDRLSKPNIFAKKIGSSGVERLVYHGKNNSQASTFNDYIVYSSRERVNEFGRNMFNLYLISTKSESIRRLTTQGINQFPKFSKDGESILFIKNYNENSYLGIIRLNYNKSFLFSLKSGKLQSIDW
ncbi:MAG TPA: Tol-Pal system protein TolB [Arcobacter sp.]|nr:Tol-Pal system protein TolB [Arcobacter sp.]